jgi:hypothetical protein
MTIEPVRYYTLQPTNVGRIKVSLAPHGEFIGRQSLVDYALSRPRRELVDGIREVYQGNSLTQDPTMYAGSTRAYWAKLPKLALAVVYADCYETRCELAVERLTGEAEPWKA